MNRRRPHAPRRGGLRPPGFTLIELLVVLAILAVLAALLAAAALEAIGLAWMVRCQGQLRHIGVAYRQYLTDSGGVWPPILTSEAPTALLERIEAESGYAPALRAPARGQPGPHWSIVLWPYLQTFQVCTCPNDPRKGLRGEEVVALQGRGAVALVDAPPESYGLNIILFRTADDMRRRAGCAWGTRGDSDYSGLTSCTTLAEQRRQFPALDSRILMFCGTAGQTVGSQYNIAFRTSGLVERWEWHPRRASAAFADEPGRGANYLFAGGHVEFRDELPGPWEWGYDLGGDPAADAASGAASP
ncbi:MAG: prepilin-type N-terminal cleavage/methylation domain-containing protein [Planctomycetes bacterium]|nr:prepilin-type N-terminal cleavage/methylation domain-containing protein [Planctomycetota bacterium]